MAASQFDKLASSFQSLTSVMQTSLNGVSAAAQVANFALDGFSNMVHKIAGQIGGLVKLISPGVFDQFTRSMNAFNAQLGATFLPVLQGLGKLVQTVANALAGLTGNGRLFLVFLAGTAVGLGVAVAVGGIFLTILGSVAGAMVAGAVAGQLLVVVLDGLTFGLAEIGQLIGAVVSLQVAAGAVGVGAAAGGIAGLGLAAGTLGDFTAALKPFLELLIGTFNDLGAKLIPGMTQIAKDLLPSVSRFLAVLVKYLEPFALILGGLASSILPALLDVLTAVLEAVLPIIVVMANVAVVGFKVVGMFIELAAVLIKVATVLSPVLLLLRGLAYLLSSDVKPGKAGNAAPPVTGVSFMGVEDAFKKAQEQALLGALGVEKKKDFEQVMDSDSIITKWAKAFGRAVVEAGINQGQNRGLDAAGAAVPGINLARLGWGIARGMMRGNQPAE